MFLPCPGAGGKPTVSFEVVGSHGRSRRYTACPYFYEVDSLFKTMRTNNFLIDTKGRCNIESVIFFSFSCFCMAFPHLGSTVQQVTFLIRFTLFVMSSSLTPAIVMSLIHSCLSPVYVWPPSSSLPWHVRTYRSSSLLTTWPFTNSCVSLLLSWTLVIVVIHIVCLFWFLSFFVTAHVHPSILISFTSSHSSVI